MSVTNPVRQPLSLPLMRAESHAKRVVVVCHAWYGDVIGGSFRLATEFAVHLAAGGHDVTYVCCQPSANASAESEVLEGVSVLRYPTPGATWSRLRKFRHHVTQTQATVAEVHRAGAIDALSGHSPLQFLGGTRALRHAQARCSYVVHSPFDDELSSNREGPPGFGTRLAMQLARKVERWNLQAADVVQTDSQFTLRTLTSKYGSAIGQKGVVAPGWVDTHTFQPVGSRCEARRQLGPAWQTEVPIFFTLRRLEQRMGIETLILAAGRLKRNGASFRVLIGGSGSQLPRYEELVKQQNLDETVWFLGRVPDDEVSTAYASADCFVLPTKALECFGLIVLEAFASGTPVIASDVAAIPELARLQGEGWMFPPGDEAALADRMRSFLAGELRVAVNLRRCAMEYDRSVVADHWESLLFSQVEASGP